MCALGRRYRANCSQEHCCHQDAKASRPTEREELACRVLPPCVGTRRVGSRAGGGGESARFREDEQSIRASSRLDSNKSSASPPHSTNGRSGGKWRSRRHGLGWDVHLPQRPNVSGWRDRWLPHTLVCKRRMLGLYRWHAGLVQHQQPWRCRPPGYMCACSSTSATLTTKSASLTAAAFHRLLRNAWRR